MAMDLLWPHFVVGDRSNAAAFKRRNVEDVKQPVLLQ